MGIFLLPSRLAFCNSQGSRTSSKVTASPFLSRAFTCPALISKSIRQLVTSSFWVLGFNSQNPSAPRRHVASHLILRHGRHLTGSYMPGGQRRCESSV